MFMAHSTSCEFYVFLNSASVFKFKFNAFLDTLIQERFFIIEITNFRGGLTDISAENEALISKYNSNIHGTLSEFCVILTALYPSKAKWRKPKRSGAEQFLTNTVMITHSM